MGIDNKKMSGAIRALAMDAVEKANSGHPGMPLGMADVATVLFKDFLKFNPKDPNWQDRDRFILSAGHGSMLLYSLLYLTGYEDITIDEIKNFRQLHAKTAGHPEYGVAGGIETTTGPLGQGIATAVGFALAQKMENARFGNDISDHYTYVIAGDGCLMEGISHEAISLAGHLKLEKLIVLFDDNNISIDGELSLSVSDDQLKRFESSGWDVVAINGHNEDEIYKAIENAKKSDKPSLIACKTTIAYGAPTKAGKSSSHGAPLGEDEIAGVRKNIGWDSEPFIIPDNILSAWRDIFQNRNNDLYEKWQDNFKKLDSAKKKEFERLISQKLPENLNSEIIKYKKQLSEDKPKWATRKSSGEFLKYIGNIIPELIGGSADLTGSNLTKTDDMLPISRDDFSGRYVYYGVREHGMAAAMNGMALHGGFIPYGGTFLVFTDYCKPAIRLSALMKQRVIYVMTHDSIGLGEDGPTHQPIEHLASLRAIPNLNVFRPADAVETAECWQIALEEKDTPSILALTRQGLPNIRNEHRDENLSKKGAYIISQEQGDLQVTIFATGSEVEIAINAQKILQEQKIGVRVVSVVSKEKFFAQNMDYKTSILCNNSIKIAVEAGISQGWERFVGPHGVFIGMDRFGESAPADKLYEYFGITAENIVEHVNKKLSG